MPSLTRLRSLSLSHWELSAEGYAPLARATWLVCLRLDFAAALPACLPAMTWLQELELLFMDTPLEVEGPAEWSQLLASAIRPLSQLRHLCVGPEEDAVADPQPLLAAAAGLCHLRSFCWQGDCLEPQPALPAGPWLSGLRRLGLPVHVAAASTVQLLEARRLECLTLYGEGSVQANLSLLEWAPQHPSLRTLGMGIWPYPEIQAAVERMRQQHPCLEIVEWHKLSPPFSDRADVAAAFDPAQELAFRCSPQSCML